MTTTAIGQAPPGGGGPGGIVNQDICWHIKPAICEEVNFPRCNTVQPDAPIPVFNDNVGIAGNFIIVCPTFSYQDCPAGLMQSTIVDDTPQWIEEPLSPNQVGSAYIQTDVPEPQVCFRDEPCRLNPEISTRPSQNCVDCKLLDPATGELIDDLFNNIGERCSFEHYCVGILDPPPNLISETTLSYAIFEVNENCQALYGGP